MLKELVYSVIDYFLDPKRTIEKISNDSVEIEKLGIIGGISTFFASLFGLFSRIDIGILGASIYLLFALIYAVFVIGFSLVIGKKPSIDTPKVFWFLFSIGIIDLLVIIFFPISLLARWVMSIVVAVVFFIKLYYLITGISTIFRIPRSTAFLIILSPHILAGVILMLVLTSSYVTISGALESLLR
ncbi:MAG: hypothetical protein ABDH28_02920 [Brevinematia bacterium]